MNREWSKLTEMKISEVSMSRTMTLVDGLACLRIHYLFSRASPFLGIRDWRRENCQAESQASTFQRTLIEVGSWNEEVSLLSTEDLFSRTPANNRMLKPW